MQYFVDWSTLPASLISDNLLNDRYEYTFITNESKRIMKLLDNIPT